MRALNLPAANRSRIVSFIRISFLPGNAGDSGPIAVEAHRIPANSTINLKQFLWS
jgi:hypothetical protein